ncbi:MAG: DUF4833 domain-containing protein [Mangrovibacterium sp.]
MAKIISILLLYLVIDSSFSQDKLNIHQFPEPERTSKLLFDYKVTIAAWSKKAIYIKQISPFRVIAFINIKGTYSILEHIFIGSDPEGRLNRAEYIEIYGLAQKNLTRNYERILL